MGSFDLNVLDVVVLVIGLAWLIAKPGLWPIVFLTVFQLLALAINVVSFTDAEVGTNPHKALLVHMIWRVMALFLMWRAYVQTTASNTVTPAAAGS